jgi:hypothetical protein
MVPEVVAVICAGLFAGAAIYINAVEHPARMECGTALALRQFAPSYRRATVMQASLAVLGLVAGLGAWLRGGPLAWLVGGLLLGAVVPFTLIGIFPTNRRLLARDLDPASSEATALLRRWGWLHAVRSVLASAAFVVMLVALASPSTP